MRIWLSAGVPGKALPGERARRRAVEGQEGAEQAYPPILRPVPSGDASRLPTRADSHPRNTPASVGQGRERRAIRVAGRSTEMEVIRDQF